MRRREDTGPACPDLAALLRASSGEVLSRETRRVQAHAETCAACAEEMRRIDAANSDMRAVRDADAGARPFHPATQEARFARRLHERKQARIHRPSRRPIGRWLPAAAIFPLIVLTVLLSRTHTAVLRADALLQRAVTESHTLPPGLEQAQRVRIEFKPAKERAAAALRQAAATIGQASTQTDAVSVVRELVNGLAIASGTEPPAASLAPPGALAQVLDLQPVDWQRPLGIERLQTWRLALTDKQDQITPIGHDLVALRTTTMQGVLREVTLIMRRDSYRVIKQTLVFDGFGRVEIEEIAQRLRPVQPAARPTPMVASAETAAPAATDAADADDMERAEIEARFVLRDTELDLGGDVHVARVHELVRVDGAVASAEQRRAVGTRLTALPRVHVALRVKTGASGAGANGAAPAAGAARPDLSGWVSRNFEEGAAARATFMPELTRLASTVARRLDALQELAQRYPDAQVQRLTPDARARLRTLVNRHYAALNADLEALNRRMAVLLGSTPRNLPLAHAPSDWTRRATAGLAHARAFDQLVQELLTHVDISEDGGRGTAESMAHTFSALWDAVNAPPVASS